MSETPRSEHRQTIESRLKEVGIAVPIVKVEYDEGVIQHVWYHHLDKDISVDLIEMFDIIEIRKVINVQDQLAVQLIIDGYLSEGDKEMSEVAEPENGEEQEPAEGEESAENENGDEGEESEASA